MSCLIRGKKINPNSTVAKYHFYLMELKSNMTRAVDVLNCSVLKESSILHFLIVTKKSLSMV